MLERWKGDEMTSAAQFSRTHSTSRTTVRAPRSAPLDLPASFDDLPRPIARPVQWGRLKLHLGRLHGGDPAHAVDSAFAVADAIGGMSDERHLRRLWRTARGRALIASGSSLAEALADREALAALAPGSLGRAFLAHCERAGIDVLELVRSAHAMSRDYAELDPIRRWLFDRLTVVHDLWHVLVGYDTQTPGESALMGFALFQRANDRALPIFIVMSVASGQLPARDALRAIARGRRAVYLMEERFEELLPLPLETVRARLRIVPPRIAHPGAVPEGLLLPEVARA